MEEKNSEVMVLTDIEPKTVVAVVSNGKVVKGTVTGASDEVLELVVHVVTDVMVSTFKHFQEKDGEGREAVMSVLNGFLGRLNKSIMTGIASEVIRGKFNGNPEDEELADILLKKFEKFMEDKEKEEGEEE